MYRAGGAYGGAAAALAAQPLADYRHIILNTDGLRRANINACLTPGAFIFINIEHLLPHHGQELNPFNLSESCPLADTTQHGLRVNHPGPRNSVNSIIEQDRR